MPSMYADMADYHAIIYKKASFLALAGYPMSLLALLLQRPSLVCYSSLRLLEELFVRWTIHLVSHLLPVVKVLIKEIRPHCRPGSAHDRGPGLLVGVPTIEYVGDEILEMLGFAPQVIRLRRAI